MITSLETFLSATPEEVAAWCWKNYPELGPTEIVIMSAGCDSLHNIYDFDICLPVFAFRLREKAKEKNIRILMSYQMSVFTDISKCGPPNTEAEYEVYCNWWMLHSKPIHWIAAAHLALKGGVWK